MFIIISKVLSRITKRQLAVLIQDPQAEWTGIDSRDESELPNLEAEMSVGGIYLRLLAANPGWALRKPKETVGELFEAALQGIQKDGVHIYIYLYFLGLYYFVINLESIDKSKINQTAVRMEFYLANCL